jgi:AcrR family transcriptional regulator
MPTRDLASSQAAPEVASGAAAARILDAAARCVRTRGAADTSVQDVAAEAGVSKALIHYHFKTKEALLARLVRWLADGVVARERAALADAQPAGAVDRLWAWLAAELARGDIRVLAELTGAPAPEVRRASAAAAQERRAAAVGTVGRIFDLLSLRPRVPGEMLASVIVAFVDGLAVHAAVEASENPRVAFDVFWLALLGLAE